MRSTLFGAWSPCCRSASVKLLLCQLPGVRDRNSDPLNALPPSLGIMFRRTPDACTSAVKVTVSSIAPTFRSALTVAVKPAGSSMPARLTTLKPASVNVTVYSPGRRSIIRKSPATSVVTVLTFSIRAGLLASTVTPGSTAPVASFTTPAMALCASARSGNNASMANPASTTTATLLLTIIASQRGPQNDRECDSPRIAVESEPGSGRQAHGDDDDDRARLALYGEQRIATHMRCVRFCEKATPADGVSQRPGGADR